MKTQAQFIKTNQFFLDSPAVSHITEKFGTEAFAVICAINLDSNSNTIGLFNLSLDSVASRTKVNLSLVKEIVDELTNIDYCEYDDKYKIIWIKESLFNNFGDYTEQTDKSNLFISSQFAKANKYSQVTMNFYKTNSVKYDMCSKRDKNEMMRLIQAEKMKARDQVTEQLVENIIKLYNSFAIRFETVFKKGRAGKVIVSRIESIVKSKSANFKSIDDWNNLLKSKVSMRDFFDLPAIISEIESKISIEINKQEQSQPVVAEVTTFDCKEEIINHANQNNKSESDAIDIKQEIINSEPENKNIVIANLADYEAMKKRNKTDDEDDGDIYNISALIARHRA